MILVTGGSGFVGRAIVGALLAGGESVRVLSRRAGSRAIPNLSVFSGDITSDADVKAALADCSAVFHCAAEKNDVALMEEVNVAATKRVFELAAGSGVEFFCHLSSVGSTGLTDKRVVDESTPCNPMNDYERTKVASEEIVARGLPDGRVVILRPTNVFGAATLGPWLRNSLPAKLQRMVKGSESAHLVYVKDVAAAAVHLFRLRPGAPVEIYIVSSDEEPGNTVKGVQALIGAAMPGAPKKVPLSAPLFVPYILRRVKQRRVNRGDIVYSSRKLKACGFHFPFGLAGGITDAAAVFRRNLERADADAETR